MGASWRRGITRRCCADPTVTTGGCSSGNLAASLAPCRGRPYSDGALARPGMRSGLPVGGGVHLGRAVEVASAGVPPRRLLTLLNYDFACDMRPHAVVVEVFARGIERVGKRLSR